MDKTENSKQKIVKIVWTYAKYQLITKGLIAIGLFPLARFILDLLLKSTGRVNISSGDYLEFLFSFQGVGMLIIGLIIMVILVGVDINAFIIMSALVKEEKVKIDSMSMIKIGLESIKSFLKPSGLLIVLYVAIVVPLVGIGISIRPMKDFQIPNFITEVIFSNKLYNLSYKAIMVILAFISFKYIFVFHYALINKDSINDSLKKSSRLVRENWLSIIKSFIFLCFRFILPFVAFLVIYRIIGNTIYKLIPSFIVDKRVWLLFIIIVFSELLAGLALMIVPIFCYWITNLFYVFNEKDGNKITFSLNESLEDKVEEPPVKKKRLFKRPGIVYFSTFFIINFIIAIFFNINFDKTLLDNKKIEIVAHRAGGNLGAENTLFGLEQAIKNGASWSEIDVQRTKDGHYILNHDSNFARLAGEKKSPIQMNLEEIKKLRIKDQFDPSRKTQEVPTIEEFLDKAKGKIGLFIELKGATADEKMVDDLVRIIKEKDMVDETAILSLDYSLIEYTEQKYPEMKTGFLYFFSIGNLAQMKGDILIMEEREATPEKIKEIHSAGKKAVVWTVNKKESINKFVRSQVDGIITDYVLDVKEGIRKRDERTDLKRIIDYFFYK